MYSRNLNDHTLTSFKPMFVPYATFLTVFMVEYAVLVDMINPVSVVGTSADTMSPGIFVGRFFCFLYLMKMKTPRTTLAVKIAMVTTNRPAVTDSSMDRFDCIVISIGSCELVGLTELVGLS